MIRKMLAMNIKTLSKSNLSQVLAAKLEKMIIEKQIKAGELLPSASELCDLYGVSRTIVREALVSLQERGLVDVKTGVGATVVRPNGNTLGETVKRLVSLSIVSYRDVYDLRIILETTACKLAALTRTKEDIKQLLNILEKMKASPGQKQWTEYELEFHFAIAKISGNNLFSIIISQLSDTLEDFFNLTYSNREEAFNDHKEIFEAIETGNPDKAYQVMLKHLSFDLKSKQYKALTELEEMQ